MTKSRSKGDSRRRRERARVGKFGSLVGLVPEPIQDRPDYHARGGAHSEENLIVINEVRSCYGDGKPIAIYLISWRDNSYHRLPPIPQVDRGTLLRCQFLVLNEKLYILGGKEELLLSGNVNLIPGSKGVYMLDLAGQMQWKQCANMQEDRAGFLCSVLDGKIYVFGGVSLETVGGSGALSEVYDPSMNTWSVMSSHDQWRYSQEIINRCVSSYSLQVECAPDWSIFNQKLQRPSGRQVYPYYSIKDIPGDGRCLFRSVAHGASLRCGSMIPDEDRQRERADELRMQAVDELVRQRNEMEDLILGELGRDFDEYVRKMRDPSEWGGEMEVAMLTQVLEMPISVYIKDQDTPGGLICVGAYGQEYGTDRPIQIFHHGRHCNSIKIYNEEEAPEIFGD